MDAERVHVLLGRFYDVMDGIIENYGGHVIDHAGDGVLAAFGAPIAHDNDGERAVRAALEMHTAAPRVTYIADQPLQMHIAIASGEIVAAVIDGGAQPKYAITGDTVNLAARLCARAQAGQTLISAAVHQAVSHIASTQAVGEALLKGFPNPVPVWSIGELLPAPGARHTFVGRQAELRQLTGLIESAMESGTGSAICVRGAPGIGKSRLVRELCSAASRRGLACHTGYILDFGVGKGKDALPVMLKDLFEMPACADESVRRAGIQRGLKEGLFAAEHEVFINDLLDVEQPPALLFVFDAMDNAARLRRSGEAIVEVIRRACARRPRLLVIEDIHWVSPALLSHLALLTIATTRCPLILIMTSRGEGDPLDKIWRASTHASPLMTIDLGPLRQEDAQLLAANLIDVSNLVARDCVERAEGNPLFLEQLLHSARESELSNVPASIQSLVLARMDRLAPRDKAALQAASVMGKRFAMDALKHLVDDPAYRGDALFSADLVRPERDEFVFAHALIQEGVYSSLLTGKRRELHRKAAHWYAGRELDLRAGHLDRADDPEAPAAYLAAAADLADRHRYDSALRLAERGLKLATSNEGQCGLLLLRGELLLESGRSQESTAAYKTALDLAADDTKRCVAWMGIAAADRVTGDIPAAMHALDQAEPIAVRLGLDVERSKIHHTRGNLYFVLGNGEACNEQHKMALEIARHCGDAECEARALSGLGDGQYVQGRMLTALEYFRRCVEISRHEGLLRVEIPNRCMEGQCLWHANQLDLAVVEAQAARESAQAVGLLQGEIFAQESLSLFLVEAGRYEEGEQACIRGLSLARSARARRYESALLYSLATIRMVQGNSDAARDHLLQAMDLTRQSGPGFLEPAIFGKFSLIARQPAERKQALLNGEISLQQDCISHCYVWFYRDAIDATLTAGDWPEAFRYIEALEEFIRPEPLPWSRVIIARGRALAQLGSKGRDAGVLAELRNVRDELERAGLRPAMAAVEAALNAR